MLKQYKYLWYIEEGDEPLEIVGGRGVVNPSQEQTQPKQPEIAFTRYSELLQTYARELKRWKESVCIPEYFMHSEAHTSSWGYRTTYPQTIPPYVGTKESYGGKYDEIEVEVIEEKYDLRASLAFNAFNYSPYNMETSNFDHNEAFKDPNTDEPLLSLHVILQQFHINNFHAIIIAATHVGQRRQQALRYLVGDRSGKPFIKIEKGAGHIGVDRDAEVLPELHAPALFNLMGELIPGTTNLPQPHHPGSGGKSGLPTLQPPQSRPTGR